MKKQTVRKKTTNYFVVKNNIATFASRKEEDWQSDRMRWTRNPVYPFPGIGGLNPSSSARDELAGMTIKVVGVCKFFFYGKVIKVKLAGSC